MADYNSAYTGQEVDAAIAKSAKIGEFATVWAGSPTSSPISLSSLPANPGTGDRTGLYYIEYDVAQSSTAPSTSFIHVSNESNDTVASGHTDMDSGEGAIYSSHVAVKSGAFQATYDKCVVNSGTFTLDQPLYIRKIWRYQLAQ